MTRSGQRSLGASGPMQGFSSTCARSGGLPRGGSCASAGDGAATARSDAMRAARTVSFVAIASVCEPERQREQGPVSTVPPACASASLTIESGTPKPLLPPSCTVAAKIVVTTRPRPSTIGPPELPERTRPRSEVIERRTGPRP